MRIERDEVIRIAERAGLELSDEEIGEMQAHLGAILGYVRQHNEVGTEDVEPMNPVPVNNNPLREDAIQPFLNRDAVLKNAPLHDGRFIRIPRRFRRTGCDNR